MHGDDFRSWTGGKICGALKALYDVRAFAARTKDNMIMYDLGKKLTKTGQLSPKQIDYVKWKLSKYAKLLSGLAITEMAVLTPDGGTSFRFTMHNARRFRVYLPEKSVLTEQIKKLTEVAKDERGFYTCAATKRNGWVLLNSGFVIDSRAQAFMDRPVPPISLVSLDNLKRKAKTYQIEGISQIAEWQGNVILADDMGLGKTFQAIAYAEHEHLRKICIICPASVKENWRIEIEKTTGDTDCCVLYGRKITEEDEQAIADSRWIIINYDLLKDWHMVLKQAGIECFIFDEVQAVKNSNTERTKISVRLAKKCPHVLALSGTPFENRPLELYSVMQMIDPALFPSKIKFAEQFCDLRIDDNGRQNMNGASNTKLLGRILRDCCMVRRKKEDVLLELPAKTRTIQPVKLALKHMREYRKVEQDFIQWVKDNGGAKKIKKGKMKAEALVKIGVLKRLAANGKMSLVFDWIDSYLETEDKLVVFAHHHDIIDAIREKYSKIAVVIDGRVPTNKRQAIVDQFQTNSKIKLFIGNIKAAGVGITLTAAKDTFTVELGWTSTAHDQAEDRVHRIGQHFPVTAYYMIAQDTVEQRIMSLLDNKRTIISEIMDGKDVVDDVLFSELLESFDF